MSKGKPTLPGGNIGRPSPGASPFAPSGMNPWANPQMSAQVGNAPVGTFTGKPEVNGGTAPTQMPMGGGYAPMNAGYAGKPEVNVMPQMGPDGPMMTGPMGVPIQRPMRDPPRMQMPQSLPQQQLQLPRSRIANLPNAMGYRR